MTAAHQSTSHGDSNNQRSNDYSYADGQCGDTRVEGAGAHPHQHLAGGRDRIGALAGSEGSE